MDFHSFIRIYISYRKKNKHNKNHFSAKLKKKKKKNPTTTREPRDPDSLFSTHIHQIYIKLFWIQRDSYCSSDSQPGPPRPTASRLVHNTNHQFLKTVLQHKCDIFNTWLLLKSLQTLTRTHRHTNTHLGSK